MSCEDPTEKSYYLANFTDIYVFTVLLQLLEWQGTTLPSVMVVETDKPQISIAKKSKEIASYMCQWPFTLFRQCHV